jgi:hypothetical protein
MVLKLVNTEDRMRLLNSYECLGDCEWREQHDPNAWEEVADCECNDRCPICNAEIEPSDSEELIDGNGS